ncbi:MAG: hypothetical protein ACP5O2_02175 [Bacteroidales bacterium]
MKKWLPPLFGFLIGNYLHAQVSDYTLFRQASAWLNPALTGTGPEKWKLTALLQRRTVNDTLSHQNQLFAADYRFDFFRQRRDYGLVLNRRYPVALSVGIFSERRSSTHYGYPYHRMGLAISGMVFSEAETHVLAFSLRPVFHESAPYTPITQTTLSPFTDSIMPGHAHERLFTADAGIILGWGKMDCWTDDQAYRWELGFSVLNLTMKQQTRRPDVHPGREYHAHVGVLWEWGQKWGWVLRGLYINNGEKFYHPTLTLLYRRHFSMVDRLRFTLGYRSSGHLSVSGGFRVFGSGRQTLSADLELAHDFPLKNQNIIWPWHKSAWEISLIIKPIRKCWGLDNCSGTYQYESY